ncbi:MAG: serine/threonine protein kinase [Kofleriaceae bacterium]|nr:serine/threonine protein kinase [Kofleriaceae bacterium]MBP9168901.1 serine/threonine protein kinase [Kofleriaceae bacterium]MBP9859610.1 serine/threonine protein kinase [Kofleriaceae bacterium]
MTVDSSHPTLPSGMFAVVDVAQVVLDRYRLEAPLGAGGMGSVWRARDTVLGREVALKIMSLEDPLARGRFLREGKLAARLDHPGLCKIYDVGQDGPRGFLVMELLSGQTLFRLADGGLPLSRALAVTAEVARAMAHAHQAGMIHRDLKPDNILIDRRGDAERAVVIDFGLAFSLDGADATGRLTQADVTGGTPMYMSPEQARAAPLTAASDVYALGCILFELCADRPPFDGAAALVMSKHVYTAPPVLTALVPGLPDAVGVLVGRMLQKAPADRPTMAEVAVSCERLATQLDGGGWRPGFGRGKVVEDRAHRMVTQTEAAQAVPTGAVLGTVAVIGAIPDEVMVALAASGVACHRSVPAEAAAADLIVVDADSPTVDACLATGRPVIAAVAAGDIAASLTLARRGVADVLTRPLAADVAARKIERRLRRAKPGTP